MHDDSPDSRTRILDAAEDSFADAGFAGARVATIARDAGVNKALLYYYFKSKEELYVAVMERVFDQVAELVQGTWQAPAEPGLEPVQRFLQGYRGIIEHHPAFIRLMLRELADGGDRALPIVGTRIATFMPLIAGSVAQAQQAGKANPLVHPAAVGPIMVSPMLFFALIQPIFSRASGLPPEQLADVYHATLAEVVLHGLTPPQERS